MIEWYWSGYWVWGIQQIFAKKRDIELRKFYRVDIKGAISYNVMEKNFSSFASPISPRISDFFTIFHKRKALRIYFILLYAFLEAETKFLRVECLYRDTIHSPHTDIRKPFVRKSNFSPHVYPFIIIFSTTT